MNKEFEQFLRQEIKISKKQYDNLDLQEKILINKRFGDEVVAPPLHLVVANTLKRVWSNFGSNTGTETQRQTRTESDDTVSSGQSKKNN